MIRQLGYQKDEHCQVLIGNRWHKAIVVKRYKNEVYYVQLSEQTIMETGEEKFADVSLKNMTRASVYVCEHCGNWIDPADVPVLGTLEGSTEDITMEVDLHCPHGGIPWSMRRKPVNEVDGVTAIGGIRAI